MVRTAPHDEGPLSPTLIDIARETSTSVSTVSRVLTGGAVAQRISEQTRGRVLEAASRLGYRPNLLARSLRTRKTHAVALLVSDIANPFFSQIASLVEQSLHKHGYSLVLCNSGEDPDREDEYLNLLPRKGIDALILVPMARGRKAVTASLPKNLPLVVLDRPIPGIAACVSSDQEQAAAALSDALARAGVRKIALICGPQVIFTHRRRTEIISHRFEIVAKFEGTAQVESGRAAGAKLNGAHPDAVICTNNLLGQGYLESLGRNGSPPIVGIFDDVPMMHLLPLPIVCSVQDIPRLAEACVRQLLAQLLEPNRAPEPMLLPTRVVTNAAFDAIAN
jgi:LacI family transcriptional regulator